MSSIRRTDILALSNLRSDGRQPHELRRLRIHFGHHHTDNHTNTTNAAATGTALVEMGLTKVLATVTGPIPCQRRSDERVDRGIVEVQLSVAPFASADRRTVNATNDRRWMEASSQLEQALSAAILLTTYPKARIVVAISVLADDGGKVSCAVNAASMALMDAGIAMKDFVVACAAGRVENNATGGGTDTTTALVDLNRREESSGSVLPVAILPQRGTIVWTQSDARVPDFEAVERVLEAAVQGCHAVFDSMQAAVKERAATTLAARRGTAMVRVAKDACVER